jgi:hypothetical protein
MGKPQKSSVAGMARGKLAGVEREWLDAQLADEAAYWKLQAQLFERVDDELRVELDALHQESERSEARRSPPSERRVALAKVKPVERPKPAVGRGAQMALSACALLSVLAYAVYRLVAG